MNWICDFTFTSPELLEQNKMCTMLEQVSEKQEILILVPNGCMLMKGNGHGGESVVEETGYTSSTFCHGVNSCGL